MTDWFARPVLHVSDVEASLRFYIDQLGFTIPWRYEAGHKSASSPRSRFLGPFLGLSPKPPADEWFGLHAPTEELAITDADA